MSKKDSYWSKIEVNYIYKTCSVGREWSDKIIVKYSLENYAEGNKCKLEISLATVG